MNKLIHRISIVNRFCLGLILILILCNVNSHAQYTYKSYNLVWNPSFDSVTTCSLSNNGSNIYKVIPPWFNPNYDTTNGPSVINTCTTDSCCMLPFQLWGLNYQWPHSGQGCVLELVTASKSLSSNQNFTDYITAPLKQDLIKNKKYLVEFFSVSAETVKYFQNNITLGFTTYQLNQQNRQCKIINNNALVYAYGNPIIADTQNWIRIAGIFKADSSYKFLTIGSFQLQSQTKYKQVFFPNNYFLTDYFIDDVSVIPSIAYNSKPMQGEILP